MPSRPRAGSSCDRLMSGDRGRVIVTINDVSVTYGLGRTRVRALDHVSLTVREKEALGIIGETGSGKTTLLRAVAGLVRLSVGSISFGLSGSGQRSSLRRGSAPVQVVFQDPSGALNPRLPVWRSIVEPMSPSAWRSPVTLRPAAIELMSRMGLSPDLANRLPREMSGGQRQRVTIARALASSAPVVLFDEPVASLDASVQGEVLDLLADLRAERALTYIVISHDLGAVARLADRVAVLYLGQVIEIAPTSEILTQPQHPYTRALIDAVPRLTNRGNGKRVVIAGEMPDPRHPPAGCRFHTRCPYARDLCADTPPELSPTGPNSGTDDQHRVACHRSQEWQAEARQEERAVNPSAERRLNTRDENSNK
jgi:oligopeptide/dipeptide ABC transporter ATP-binding protein